MIHFRVRYERLRDRFARGRTVALVLRATWIALVVPLSAALARIVVGGAVPNVAWIAAMATALAAAVVLSRRSTWCAEPQRWMDRHYALDDLLVTAVEVDRRGPRSGVDVRLLDDAAAAVARIARAPSPVARRARREAETLVAIALLVSGLWSIGAVRVGPDPTPSLPALELAAGSPSASSGGANAVAPRQADAASAGAMRAVAMALADRPVARDAVSALAAGDVPSAARAVRALAERLEQLSPAGRRDLAEALHGAADATQTDDPELSDALRGAARELESPATDGAAARVEMVAAALDTLPSRGRVAGDGIAPPRPVSRADARPPRPAVTAVPAPLAATRGTGRAATGRGGLGAAPVAPVAPAAEVVGGGAAPGRVTTAVDPLAYPWALRAAIRGYFARGIDAP